MSKKKKQRLRGKGHNVKTMRPVVAFAFAAIFGIGAITMVTPITAALFKIIDSKKLPSTRTDWVLLGFFVLLGLCAYGATILFQVYHKRVIDYLYETESIK